MPICNSAHANAALCQTEIYSFLLALSSKRILPPLLSVLSQRSNDNDTADESPNGKNGEEPAVANGVDDWRCNDTADAGKDVADKVVDCNSMGCLLRHKLRQHCRYRGKQQHGANAEEKVCYHLAEIVSTAYATISLMQGDTYRRHNHDPILGRPAVP